MRSVSSAWTSIPISISRHLDSHHRHLVLVNPSRRLLYRLRPRPPRHLLLLLLLCRPVNHVDVFAAAQPNAGRHHARRNPRQLALRSLRRLRLPPRPRLHQTSPSQVAQRPQRVRHRSGHVASRQDPGHHRRAGRSGLLPPGLQRPQSGRRRRRHSERKRPTMAARGHDLRRVVDRSRRRSTGRPGNAATERVRYPSAGLPLLVMEAVSGVPASATAAGIPLPSL